MGKCQICGKGTKFNFPLCSDCNEKKEQGLIVQDENGKWKLKEETKTPVTEDKPLEITCLICGKPSNGKHFCLDCWKLYGNRSVDIRLKNLKYDCILDDYGNLKYKCEDGRYVRSLQEQSIANTLWNLEIQYIYEEEVYYYTEDEKAKTLHPDFFLPKYNVYIEHIGFTNKKHNEITEFKKKEYNKQGKKVLFTNPETLTDFKQFIKKELKLN